MYSQWEKPQSHVEEGAAVGRYGELGPLMQLATRSGRVLSASLQCFALCHTQRYQLLVAL